MSRGRARRVAASRRSRRSRSSSRAGWCCARSESGRRARCSRRARSRRRTACSSPRSTRRAATRRSAASSRVDLALGREIAQREGIKAVVTGSVASAGTGFIITGRLVSAASGDELAVYQESASTADEIIPAVDRLTRKLRGKIGESLKSVADAPPLSQVTTSSLDALRSFAAGLRANDVEGDFPKATTLFEDA